MGKLPMEHGYALVLQGNVMYGVDSSDFNAADLSDLKNPRQLGSIELRSHTSISLVDRHAFAVSNGGLVVIDIADPSIPVVVGQHPLHFDDGEPKIVATGSHVCVTDGEFLQLGIIDVTDPRNPKGVGSEQLTLTELEKAALRSPIQGIEAQCTSEGVKFQIRAKYVYGFVQYTSPAAGAGRLPGLAVLDISDPLRPKPVSIVKLPDEATQKLTTLELADVSDPQLKLEWRAFGSGVASLQDVLFAASQYGLLILDVSNPKSPKLKAHWKLPTARSNFQQYWWQSGGYFQWRDGSFRGYDQSEPWDFPFLAVYPSHLLLALKDPVPPEEGIQDFVLVLAPSGG